MFVGSATAISITINTPVYKSKMGTFSVEAHRGWLRWQMVAIMSRSPSFPELELGIPSPKNSGGVWTQMSWIQTLALSDFTASASVSPSVKRTTAGPASQGCDETSVGHLV